MAITLQKRREGTYPLEVFQTSSKSTYRQKMESKQLKHLNMFPRKCYYLLLVGSNFQYSGHLLLTRSSDSNIVYIAISCKPRMASHRSDSIDNFQIG
jgi:uncharacterized cysteine cluster protein YcgN (CxxCxxCC family)